MAVEVARRGNLELPAKQGKMVQEMNQGILKGEKTNENSEIGQEDQLIIIEEVSKHGQTVGHLGRTVHSFTFNMSIVSKM